MTLLCAPVKELIKTDKVDLLELDHGTHKVLYDGEGRRRHIDIASYHNYEETPDLESILKMLQSSHPNADLYKIATKANSILDSLRMLEFQRPGLIGVCMGELGAITRICAPIFGTPIVYAPLREEDKNAPGQLLVSELCEIYHFRKLGRQTRLFGLIGSPVKQSLGHLFHNEHLTNAVYVKMEVKPDELREFFDHAKRLKFAGLSVTAPLKEAVIPFLDAIDPIAEAIGAVNTITFHQNRLKGYNTDGPAALDVLGNVKGKTIVVLGAGGAARAIIYTALQRKAKVIVVNRTVARAQKLADLYRCRWSEHVLPYDIMVNATSASMPIDAREIHPHTNVMDIALYETEFLKKARLKQCKCKDGLPMYFQQALSQLRFFS